MRTITTTSVLLALLWLFSSPAPGQTFPSKVIRIVVPFPPAGVSDIAARITADYMSTAVGKQVIVENRSGAGGNLGAAEVAKAEPDGHTLSLGTTGNIVINPFLYKRMPFDVLEDLVPVAPIGEAPQLLIINANLPAKTLQEFIALAKSQPGKFAYGSAGTGSTAHLGADRFARLAGVDMIHVPYRGIGPAVTDLVSGNIQMLSVSAGPVIGHFRAGTLRFLATASDKRLPYLPEVPTSAEAGLPGYEMTTWFGLLAPKGTPEPIVNQLNGYVQAMFKDKTAMARMDAAFLTPMPMSAAEYAAFVKADYRKWEHVVHASGLQPEQ